MEVCHIGNNGVYRCSVFGHHCVCTVSNKVSSKVALRAMYRQVFDKSGWYYKRQIPYNLD